MADTINITQGATPTIQLDFEDIDFRLAAHVYVTISQRSTELTLSEADGVTIEGAGTLLVYLTQEQSLLFDAKEAEIMVNVTYENGSRVPSEIGYIVFDKNLKREVLA